MYIKKIDIYYACYAHIKYVIINYAHKMIIFTTQLPVYNFEGSSRNNMHYYNSKNVIMSLIQDSPEEENLYKYFHTNILLQKYISKWTLSIYCNTSLKSKLVLGANSYSNISDYAHVSLDCFLIEHNLNDNKNTYKFQIDLKNKHIQYANMLSNILKNINFRKMDNLCKDAINYSTLIGYLLCKYI